MHAKLHSLPVLAPATYHPLKVVSIPGLTVFPNPTSAQTWMDVQQHVLQLTIC